MPPAPDPLNKAADAPLAGLIGDEGLIDSMDETLGFKPSRRWVDRRVIEGMPHIKVGGKRLFNVESVRGWLLSKERSRREMPRRGRPARQRAA